MERLVAFGCSYTFGQALPGAIFDKKIPSNLSWPSMLAQHLGVDVENQGEPGASNLEILWKILNFNFDSSDMCFIMWSHFTRASIFREEGFKRLDFHTLSKYEKSWLRVHPEYDQIVHNWIYIHHATTYLNTLGIQPYHLLSGGSHPDPTKTITVPRILESKFHFIDRGDDNDHPGVHSHALLAGQIASELLRIT